jgi:hypothetical protein
MYTSLFSAPSVGYGTTTTSNHAYDAYKQYRNRRNLLQRRYWKLTFLVEVCKLWVQLGNH